jgi:hypothetical protein
LGETVVDVGASFDCSWSLWGWSARDGLVAGVSEDTGKSWMLSTWRENVTIAKEWKKRELEENWVA